MKHLCLIVLVLIFAVGCKDDGPTEPENIAPEILSMTASHLANYVGGVYDISCETVDADGDELIYNWTSGGGSFPFGYSFYIPEVRWVAPSTPGSYSITAIVSDRTTSVQDSVTIIVEENHPPNIPSDPHPSHLSIDQAMDVILSWSCSDPDNDPRVYDVFFGTSPDPPRVRTQSEVYYNPGSLSANTAYYWKIVARDYGGSSPEGPVWQFNTTS